MFGITASDDNSAVVVFHSVFAEIHLEIELIGAVESSQTTDRYFVCGHYPTFGFAEFLRVFPALDPSGKSKFIADGKVFNEAGVSAPSDTRNVIGLIVRSVDSEKNVRYFSVERSRSVNRRFANVTG